MPLTIITSSVRGWGSTPERSQAAAAERLNQLNEDVQAGNLVARQGTTMRVEEPGNGGPCGPVAVRMVDFPYLIAIEDLPEFHDRDSNGDDDD